MSVDNEYNFTPYRTTKANEEMRKEVSGGRIYSDHKAILTSFRVNDSRAKVKMADLVIKNKEGWVNLFSNTDEIADDLLELMENGTRPADLFKRAEKSLREAEFQSFKRIKITKIGRKMYGDNETFHAMVKQLEEQENAMSKMKINDKIFSVRGKKIMSEIGEEMFSMFDKNGELHETRDEILSVLTEYNDKLLGRDEHKPDFKEIHQMKVDLMETLKELLDID